MAFAYVFGVGRVGALAEGVRNPNAISGGEGKVLANVPAFGVAETAALFYDSLHRAKYTCGEKAIN
jgi:hypothetical protein